MGFLSEPMTWGGFFLWIAGWTTLLAVIKAAIKK